MNIRCRSLTRRFADLDLLLFSNSAIRCGIHAQLCTAQFPKGEGLQFKPLEDKQLGAISTADISNQKFIFRRADAASSVKADTLTASLVTLGELDDAPDVYSLDEAGRVHILFGSAY